MALFQSQTLWVSQLADGVAELVLDAPGATINTIDAQTLADLEQAVQCIADDKHFDVLVVRSAKPASFCHGLARDYLAGLPTADDFVALAQRGQALTAALAQLRVPSVAVIAGPCVDAGLELALACDFRVALDRRGVQLGLTQGDVGLAPAWGATQRLPRLIGLERSLSLVLGNRRLTAAEALQWGLVDELSVEGDSTPPALLHEPHKRDATRFTRRSPRQWLLESTSLGCRLLLRGAERVLRRRLPDALPAPLEALQALRLAVLAPQSDAGFRHEYQALGRLGTSPAFRHLVWFQQQRRQQRTATLAAAAERPGLVGLLGAGPTSLALLQEAVLRGQQVVLRAGNEEQLGMALLVLFKRLEAEARRRDVPAAELSSYLKGVRGTYTWTHFEAVDFALDLSEGRGALLREAAERVPQSALLGCGGATQQVAELQAELNQPERVAGVYFVEPLGSGSLAEIATTPTTAAATGERLSAWVSSLGHTPVRVKAGPGRLVLRVLFPGLHEAALLVREGLGIARVDAALRRFGLTHGPLEYADLVGVNVIAELARQRQPMLLDRPGAATLFQRMAERGWLGASGGIGFYQYRAGRRRHARREAEQLCRDNEAGMLPPLPIADQLRLAEERVIGAMLLEAARCSAEGVAADADTVDLALCLSIWPPHRGGPIRHARGQSAAELSARYARLERDCGQRFHLEPALADLLLCGDA